MTSPRSWPVLVLVLFGLVRDRAAASEAPPPTLNPKTYASPSDRYSLFVNPSDLFGRGKASYRLSVDGTVAWSVEKPYTLWDARVTDDGTVTGYAYSHGWRGRAEGGHREGMGDFRFVILDPRGNEHLERVTERKDSLFFHTPPNPLASGLVLDAAHDRVVVRIRDADINRQSESWWIYELSTGKSLATLRPKDLMADPEPVRSLIAAEPVAGTPLMLLHWYRCDWAKERKSGARFTLIGQDGKPVWSRDLPDDYEAAGDEAARERATASVLRSGAILGSDRAGRFALRFVKEGQRVMFVAAPAAGGVWTVTEVERRPFVEAIAPAPRPELIPVLSLRPLGQVVLKGPASGPEPEVRDVRDFAFDARGRIGFLRPSRDGTQSLVVIDQQGTIVHAVPLEPARDRSPAGWWSGPACVGLDRYLLTRNVPGDDTRTEASLVDASTGKSTPVAGFAAARGATVAGFPDGGFVVNGGGLHAYDVRGKRLWSLPGNGSPDDPAGLFSLNGVAVTTDGMIAVVSAVGERVQYFDRSGKHRRTIDLKTAWGRDPSYPSEVAADRDGGVLVEDSADWPIVRMNADGAVRSQVKPRLTDGGTFRLHDVQVAPDGAVWVSDGHALYRLAESGVVDRVIGHAPDPRRFVEAMAVALDGGGQIYGAVGRTGAVHVFGPDGRWLRVCVPGAADVPSELMLPHLTVSDRGDVYLGLDHFGPPRYLHFSPDGKRVRIETSRQDNISETWYAQPRTGRRWVLGYEKVYLVDEAGATVRTIERRADGAWLDHPEGASTAADGSIAVISRDRKGLLGGPLAVSLYSPDGEPVRTFTLPTSLKWSYPRVAYDGRRVVLTSTTSIVFFDASGEVRGRLGPPGEKDAWWTPFLARDGHELLLFNGVNTLYRFALP